MRLSAHYVGPPFWLSLGRLGGPRDPYILRADKIREKSKEREESASV